MKYKIGVIFCLMLLFLYPTYANATQSYSMEGTEGELMSLVLTPSQESTEIQEELNLVAYEYFSDFQVSEGIIFKFLKIDHYFLKDNINQKKKIYSFNQGRTYVINNSTEELNEEKIIELEIIPSTNTKEIYVAIDKAQSKTIPSMSQFVKGTNTIIVDSEKYIKIEKPFNKLRLELKPNINNFSLQIIEVNEDNKVSGIYSTNILQLSQEYFNKYAIFQINKNIIEFYCPYCQLKDYGINENGFSSCGTSIFKEEKTPITETLRKKENVCLSPDGSKISGFTNDSFDIFGFDRLYFEWSDDKIISSLFDYGEYYVDQDQFRAAISKKLNHISNDNYIELGEIKYRKGANNLISKISAYIEYDLSVYINNIDNSSIDASLNSSINILNKIPSEYQKLTIIDFTNSEPDITDIDFEKYMEESFKNNHKTKNYHTHYQISVESYINSLSTLINNAKSSSENYSKHLYGLRRITQGYKNIYLTEGLNYFIYNIKPFGDLSGETKRIMTNEFTPILTNYWTLQSLSQENYVSPKTVLVTLSEINKYKKEAKYKLEDIGSKLFTLDYFKNNEYYFYNKLFLTAINPISYNYGEEIFTLSNSINSKFANLKKTTDFSDIQDGISFSFGILGKHSFIEAQPLIITKNMDEDISIKYFKDTKYIDYDKEIKTINNDFFSESILIYVPYSNNPIIIEAINPIYFNTTNYSYEIIDNKYIYKIFSSSERNNFHQLIDGISRSENCFLIDNDSVNIWKNIDGYLDFQKSKEYVIFYDRLKNEQEKNQTTSQNQNPKTERAIYIEDNSKDNQALEAVKKYLETETEKKNMRVLNNYYDSYIELLKNKEVEAQDIFSLFNCNETLICDIIKSKEMPAGGHFSKFKTTCVPNTPSNCVKKYWYNPKVGFCSAFARSFSNHFFNNNYDSANAWDLVDQRNNVSIWNTVIGSFSEKNYNLLIPGSILGIKTNNTAHKDKKYTHVVVYLGKIGSNHYIIHSWGEKLKIEKLDVFLKTTARGKNTYGYFEDGQIKEILLSRELYNKIQTKAKEKGIILGTIDNSIYEGQIPSFVFNKFNSFEFTASLQKEEIDILMYYELNRVYDEILKKQFNIYYRQNPYSNEKEENKNITINPNIPLIILLGKYQKMFYVKKENGQTKLLLEYSVSTGTDGFGCDSKYSTTPIGLFRVVGKQGDNSPKLQIISRNGPRYSSGGKPVFASYNSGPANIVTRKLVIDGIEKGNLGKGCENGNRNTIFRGIYIHGTNHENSIGRQGSHGCVRMLNNDVIEFYNSVPIGTYLYIYNSETSYSSLLDLENRFTNLGNNLEFTLVGAKRPPIRNIIQSPQRPRKTMTDLENYINAKINQIRMLDHTTGVDLTYGQECNTIILKFPCFLKEALNVEYEKHVINPQSSEFNYIVFKVTKAFGYTLEETAQFWGSVAQESGTSTNVNGSQSQHGNSLLEKPAYGIAQIEKAPWSQYNDNRFTFDLMIRDFNNVNLSTIIAKDFKIGEVTRLTGNQNTIDSRREIIALLDLIWTNQSKYASVVFSAGLKRYLGRQLIKNSQERYNSGIITEPFWISHQKIYDHSDSINFTFAIIFFYKYTGTPNRMYDGITKYTNLKGGTDTIKTITLKLANYLAFKKEYYMYYYGLKQKEESHVISTLLNAYNGALPR